LSGGAAVARSPDDVTGSTKLRAQQPFSDSDQTPNNCFVIRRGIPVFVWTFFAFVLVRPMALDAQQSANPPGPAGGAVQQGGNASQPAPVSAQQQQQQATRPIYIAEYRVVGAHKLTPEEVEEAVYPYLGPGRTAEDVDQARAALEKAYQNKGFQTVSVRIPPQQVTGGVVVLQVVEGTVGRLRVRGARYFSPEKIKKAAPSLAEGTVPDFNQVSKEIVALNQLPDLKVTPTLRAGVVPDTVDVDLNVKDTLPLHGSLELNNRYSPDTTPLRINGVFSYNNLWQLGHSLGFSFQIDPQDSNDAEVFSAYYLLRIPQLNWLTFILQGTKQDSNVSTLGGGAVAGRNTDIGLRAVIGLPPGKDFFHSISFGIDYKKVEQNIRLGTSAITAPLTYYPWNATYSATWLKKGSETDLNAGVTFNVRGFGSPDSAFDNSRFDATGSFIYFRGDLSETLDLPAGFQLFGKVQGQIADQPLVNIEQFAGGGLTTVRGYLEAEELGDDALFGSGEFRSPSLLSYFPWFTGKGNEWRIYGFFEGGKLTLLDTLPQQTSLFELVSYGIGSRLKLEDHLNGSIDVGVPLIPGPNTAWREVRVTFRLWADF
jgi:hemolysin activation/secretion protein